VVYGVRVPRPSRRLWLAYLSAGTAGIVAYYLAPARDTGSPARVILFFAISASAALAIWYGTARHRPRARLPWLLLAAGQGVYTAAGVTFYVIHYLLDAVGHPSVTDLLYLGHYPLMVVGLVLLIRRRTAGRDLPGLLDAATIAVAAAVLSWVFVLSTETTDDEPGLVKAICTAYPVLDLVLLGVALRLVLSMPRPPSPRNPDLLGSGRRPAAFVLLTASLFATFTANMAYVLLQAHGTYQVGGPLEAVWLAGHLALGGAALHPSMTRLAERAPARPDTLGRGRFAALMAAVLLAPAALLYEWSRHDYAQIPVTALACVVLFGLTVARMAGLVTDQRRHSVTDGLTGLHTGRFADAQLALEVARARRTGGTLGVFLIDLDHFRSVNERYGRAAGDRVLVGVSARLREVARGGDVLARYGGDVFVLLAPGLGADELRGTAERLRERVAGSPVAAYADTYLALTVSVGVASYPPLASGVDALLSGLDGWVSGLDGSVDELVVTADRALSRAKATGRNRVVVGRPGGAAWTAGAADAAGGAGSGLTAASCRDAAMVDFLRHVADQVDARLSPQEHGRAVGRWSRLLAAELGHDEATVTRAELAGRLHDVGKITLPEGLLVKPTPLSEEEWLLLRQHPVHGARLAGMVPEFGGVADVIRQHHERFDGAGYPDRLAGTAIRPEARILAVCDSWAAMRSDRAYQPRLSPDAARDQLRQGRGTQFDPDIVDLFLDLLHRGLVGELSAGSGRPAWWSVTQLPRSTVH
jgi:diguanylate cyclase (GGDEF)-like protein